MTESIPQRFDRLSEVFRAFDIDGNPNPNPKLNPNSTFLNKPNQHIMVTDLHHCGLIFRIGIH